MNAKLRVAVVGAGYWGPNLARNFSTSQDWSLAAICDLDRDRAQSLADRVGRVDVHTDLDELLARDDIDAVAVATPARTHHPVVLAALRAGKHVLVEKPLADSRCRPASKWCRRPHPEASSSWPTTPIATRRRC